MEIERIAVEELREIGVRFTGSEGRANDWALVLADSRVDVRVATMSWLDSLLRCAGTDDDAAQ